MAANGILTRLAIVNGYADVFTFSFLRLTSGLTGFGLVIWFLQGQKTGVWSCGGDWRSALALFGCVFFFTAACAWTDIGPGVLVMFAVVQITLLSAAALGGESLAKGQLLGLLVAAAGLIYLSAPGQTAPSLEGVVLMAFAGLSWGLYSLFGRADSAGHVRRSAGNSIRTLPGALLLLPLAAGEPFPSPAGIACAITCGTIMTGYGYSLWYVTQKNLTGCQASLVQLMVPVLAAIGGVLFLNEPITLRLLIATALVVGGVSICLSLRKSDERL